MTFWFFIVAAALSFFGLVFHGVIGRRLYLGHINAAEMPARTKSLSAVSWDMFSVQLLVSALALVYAAFTPMAVAVVYPIIAMSLLGAGVFVGLWARGHKDLLTLPGAYLLALVGALSWLAL